MKPEGHERRHRSDEGQGIAERSLRERVPVDKLKLRDSDAGKADELRAAAKKELLAMAGYTEEKAEAELATVASKVAEVEATPKKAEKVLAPEQKVALLSKLEERFASKPERYCEGIKLADVKKALEAAGEKELYGLFQMEENGHEVRVVRAMNAGKKGFRFDSCSQESPEGIRDINYYRAEEIAKEWGIDLQDPKVFDEMRIKYKLNSKTWDHLKTDKKTLETGDSFGGFDFGLNRNFAYDLNHYGGFRCSLWVSEA
jgi:uncharacterized protein YpuA (DUF1002 family)